MAARLEKIAADAKPEESPWQNADRVKYLREQFNKASGIQDALKIRMQLAFEQTRDAA